MAAFDFEGLLGNPMFTGGLGLLAAGFDDQPIGEGLLQGLQLAGQGAQFGHETLRAREERELRRLKNETARMNLTQQRSQQQARQALFQDFAGQDVAPGTGQGFGLLTPTEATERRTPGINLNDPETFGLFATAFPDSAGSLMADSLTAQDDPTITLGNGMTVPFSELPSDVQQLVAAGVVPGTEEFGQIITQAVAQGATSEADLIMARAQAAMAGIEARRESRDERTRLFNERRTISSTFTNLRELSQLNERLEGTLGETGLGLDELRQQAAQGVAAVKQFLGVGSDRAQQVVNDVKRFEQLALKENIENVSKLKESLGGRVTEFEFDKFITTGPSPSNPTDVNRRIIADQLEDFKALAPLREVEVPGWVDAEIDQLRSATATFDTMTTSQLLSVNPARVSGPKRQELMMRLSQLDTSRLTDVQRRRLSKMIEKLGF